MKTTDYLVISASLNKDSNSRRLAKVVHAALNEKEKAEWLDLRDFDLPICDGDSAYGAPHVAKVNSAIKQAHCIIVGTPIYNFNISSSVKNLIELTGHSWEDKVVGFVCAAGGKTSYMSVMSIANSLMLDFRSIIIPRFVYADESAFEGELIDETIKARIKDLADTAIKLTNSLKFANQPA